MMLKDRIRRGDFVAGVWVKTPHVHVAEVLALSPLDVLVFDAEHAPFDRTALDACILGARAGGKPCLVRPASADPSQILNALDCGADGVVIPHVRSAEEALSAARAASYAPGGRGYTGGSRAGAWGSKGMARHRQDAKSVAVIAQIEDVEAIDAIDDIAAVEAIDALFVGRADLTISLDAPSSNDPRVVAIAAVSAFASYSSSSSSSPS
ncbi:MAG: hypothetical protein K2Q06_08260, partial [Parvularculaceae bacterium]|nr:hypothetical protein [Parvularculaceae bacterium]